MRWTRTFLSTLRNAPANVESVGHQWLIRAGLGRPGLSGQWNHLPLGYRVLRNIRRLIRSELAAAEAVEISMQDPGKTVSLIGNDLQSWRQFPLLVHQVDRAWSFDLDDRSRTNTYHKIYDTFLRLFARVGIGILEVETESGMEFQVPSTTGHASVLLCNGCKYAATPGRAECAVPKEKLSVLETTELPPLKEIPTPERTSVEEVAASMDISPRDLVKTMIFHTEKGFVAGVIRGGP